MKYQWLGTQEYQYLYQKQKESLLWKDEEEVIWGLEHPSIITLGRRSKSDVELLGLETLGSRIPFLQVDRGGQATLHSPGQLIIYPLVSLKKRNWKAKEYVCLLLQITKATLIQLGCKVDIDQEESGLFIGEKKIGFVGLRLTGGRSYHGLSINVQNDLSLFNHFRCCGVLSRSITSLHQENFTQYSTQNVFETWIQNAKASKLDLSFNN